MWLRSSENMSIRVSVIGLLTFAFFFSKTLPHPNRHSHIHPQQTRSRAFECHSMSFWYINKNTNQSLLSQQQTIEVQIDIMAKALSAGRYIEKVANVFLSQ